MGLKLSFDAAAIAGAVVSLGSVGALALLSLQAQPSIIAHVVILIGGSAATFICLARCRRVSAGAVLAAALALHVAALIGAPAFEDDYYRFIWDGWRTLSAGTPYGVAPETFYSDVDVPAAYRRVLDGVNYPEHPTIYGPALELLFAFGVLLGGANPLALRIVFATLNLAVVGLLLRGGSPKQVAFYAWSPFVVCEIALNAHPDGVMALFLVAGLALAAARPAWAGAAFGAAVACKIVALAAIPLLLRMPRRALAAAVLCMVAFYSPFLVQGAGAGFETTSMFAAEWTFNPLVYAFASALFESEVARMMCAAIGVGLIGWIYWRWRGTEAAPLSLIFGAVLLVAPAVNPWYLLWVLPFATDRREIWPYAASLALPLSYLTGLNLDDARLGAFDVHPWAWWAEICVLAAALAFDARKMLVRAKPDAREKAGAP